MASQLVAALLGALVAFGGTYLIQRGQFRRADLEGVRLRVGLARGLRADLYAAKHACAGAQKYEIFPPGLRFPTYLWVAEGHRLIAAVTNPAEGALLDAFSRLGLHNELLAAIQQSSSVAEPTPEELEGQQEAIKSVGALIEKIDLAIDVLNRREGEWLEKERRLRHPLRTRVEFWRRRTRLVSLSPQNHE